MARQSLRPAGGRNPLGGPLVHLDTTGSTNDCGRELAVAGAPHGTVVTAEEQTAGRGRQGRTWEAPRGRALTLSVLLRADRVTFDLLPLTAAVAVAEACEAAAPHATCALKWPNDVWIEGRKVAGILIEARPQEGWAVIGIGLNVSTTEEDLGPEVAKTATSLRSETGADVSREHTLETLLEKLAAWLERIAADDQGAVLAAYRERDALYGQAIAWTAGDRRFEGEAKGIDDEGNLVVFSDDGERTSLTAGEVHLRR